MTDSGTESTVERIAHVLMDAGFVTALQLEQAWQAGQLSGIDVLETLVVTDIIPRETVVTTVSFQLQVPIFDIEQHDIDPDAMAFVPREFALHHQVLPVGFADDGFLRIAIARLFPDSELADELSSMTGLKVQLALSLADGLGELIERLYAL